MNLISLVDLSSTLACEALPAALNISIRQFCEPDCVDLFPTQDIYEPLFEVFHTHYPVWPAIWARNFPLDLS